MLLFVTILGFIIAFILLGLTIYLFACAILVNRWIKQNGGLTDQNLDRLLGSNPKLNLPLKLALKIASKARISNKLAFKGILNKMQAICLSISGTLLVASLYVFAFAAVMYSLNLVTTSVTSAIGWLYNDNEGCPCYALCTGDSELDSKCTYEILFGKDAYNKFIDNASLDEYYLNQLNLCETGKEKNELLSNHINTYMINQYREDLETKKSFRSKDGQDRSKMSDNELRDDLIRLLNDYKLNGKNPTCECSKLSGSALTKFCMGEKHYKKPWSFQDIFGVDGGDEDTGTTDSGDTIAGNGKVGHATGNYVIQLDDGLTYYWYHQSGTCGCDHDILDSTYGRLSHVICGPPEKDNMAGRGCSIYSTAMALSCVLDTEITPYKVITDVLKADIKQLSDGTYHFVASGRGITNNDPAGMIMDKSMLAKSIEEVYGSQGVKAKQIGSGQDSVDGILEKGGMVIFSFQGNRDNWSWYTGAGHFMVIRKKADGLYYKLDSTANIHNGTRPRDNMNLGLTWEEIQNHIKNSGSTYGGLAIWREGANTGGSNGIGNAPSAPNISAITDADIQADIAAGKYTAEDYNYLVSIGAESGSYEGFYAVACCVRNRVNNGGGSYKAVVTAPGQFAGFRSNEIGNPRNENVKQAALAVLRGEPSTVGNATYFFGRVNGYHLWAEGTKCETFTNIGNNIFYGPYGSLHNKKSSLTSDAIIIYDKDSKKWNYPSGTTWTR